MQAVNAVTSSETKVKIHRGGCHCGRIRFEVKAPANLKLSECNCSVCAMTGYLHLIVPKSSFMLVQGQDELTTYTFNSGVARHFFCSYCGIKSFYVPRSHPEGISVNARCIDAGTVESSEIKPFDGQNWEESVAGLHSSPL